MLDDLKMIHSHDSQDMLGQAERQATEGGSRHPTLSKDLQTWLPTVPTSLNPAKQLAHELMGRSVVVYSSTSLEPSARHFKQVINRYAKQLAWTGQYDADEIASWTAQPLHKPYAVIDLIGSLDDEATVQLRQLAARKLSGRRPEPLTVVATGQSLHENILWLNTFADFVGCYLALLNGVDPAPLHLNAT